MKKLLAMLLALGMMMSLAACGEQKDNTDAPDDADTPTEITYAVEAGSAGEEVALANGFKTVVDIDLIGTFNVLRASFEFLRRPGASLISITAGQAERASLFQAHVCAAKAGINMLTKCLALEWGPGGVRVNAISPGPIAETEGMARLAPTEEAEARVNGRNPLRRYGTKDEIADMAIFLSTDKAAYVNGAIIPVDGGSGAGDASGNALGNYAAVY